MSFQVQSETLRTHATVWDGHAEDAATAGTTIEPGVGKGADFGYLAGLYGVADHYDTWTTAMATALDDAERCFRYIAAALVSTANHYDDTDATVATDMATLDAMI
ncbi:hypothetical protein [Nocardioides sp. SYSU D00038]|uniref:hypothetical protein n=1 Tax=Nocardioides sp. SYSU D00038 TaxID=2812554 RepID=UPI001967A69E|nr:hypothetical protein [Nocardioides sp. SYSU D00038]